MTASNKGLFTASPMSSIFSDAHSDHLPSNADMEEVRPNSAAARWAHTALAALRSRRRRRFLPHGTTK